jgi:ADP-ribose pyrophosphatase YjhB (NUDIX family)
LPRSPPLEGVAGAEHAARPVQDAGEDDAEAFGSLQPFPGCELLPFHPFRQACEQLPRQYRELGDSRQLVNGRALVPHVYMYTLDPMPSSQELSSWRVCPRCGSELEHGEASVSCPRCGFSAYANPAPTASALVLDDEGRVLLARRAGEPGEGLWDLPGGFMDEGERPLESLQRELREEAGVEIEPGAFVGGLPDRYGAEGPWTINFYWEARLAGGEPRAADDVAEFGWFRAHQLPPVEEFAFGNTVEILAEWGGEFSQAEARR